MRSKDKKFWEIAFILHEAHLKAIKTLSKRSKTPRRAPKIHELTSDINGITYLPDEKRLNEAKTLVNQGLLDIEDMKFYIAADFN